jgi:hypothetical protein
MIDNIRQRLKRGLMSLPGGGYALQMLHVARGGGARPEAGSAEAIFTRYYTSNGWGDRESLSGPGSSLAYTQNIRERLPKLVERYAIKSIIDVPCGDFNWFRHVELPAGVHYTGADIVKPLIERNCQLHSNHNRSFIQLDITKDKLPSADLLLCRDLLFHLSNAQVLAAIDNIRDSRIVWLLTTTHPECKKNRDIPTGSFRELNLQRPPFSFDAPIETMEDWIEGWPRRQLCLWDCRSLRR